MASHKKSRCEGISARPLPSPLADAKAAHPYDCVVCDKAGFLVCRMQRGLMHACGTHSPEPAMTYLLRPQWPCGLEAAGLATSNKTHNTNKNTSSRPRHERKQTARHCRRGQPGKFACWRSGGACNYSSVDTAG